jgi:hypothetical protein
MQTGVLDGLINGAEPGALLPHDGYTLGKFREIAARVLKLLRGSKRQSHHDLSYIFDFPELADDPLKGFSLEFAVEAGEDKGNGPFVGIPGKFLFYPVQILRTESMEGRNHPHLKEIGHAIPPDNNSAPSRRGAAYSIPHRETAAIPLTSGEGSVY